MFLLILLAVIAQYPAHWFSPIDDPHQPDWEILPQAAKPGEVILSKRNELGILSNFAATPFTFRGVRYASVEGFWQMMLYPEGPERTKVAQMTGFTAKAAGDAAEARMRQQGIDWVTFEGHRMPYRSRKKGEHYRLIVEAMRAKLAQNRQGARSPPVYREFDPKTRPCSRGARSAGMGLLQDLDGTSSRLTRSTYTPYAVCFTPGPIETVPIVPM